MSDPPDLEAAACGWTRAQTAGLLLLALAFNLWTVARFELGAHFASTARARRLATHGLYSKIRNPIYLFAA
jgi:protein-S-isoprenylcysteine O-methyltransferase Ste14